MRVHVGVLSVSESDTSNGDVGHWECLGTSDVEQDLEVRSHERARRQAIRADSRGIGLIVQHMSRFIKEPLSRTVKLFKYIFNVPWLSICSYLTVGCTLRLNIDMP